MHHIVLWKWADTRTVHRATYTADHVNHVARMLKKNLDGVQYRIICITDEPTGITEMERFPIWPDANTLANASGQNLPSCYRRLKLYDPDTQARLGIRPGDRIVSLDLDVAITGNLKAVLDMPGRFVGWELIGSTHARVLNGSFQMFTAGDLAHIWKDFNPRLSPLAAFNAGYLGSDQAWLSMHLAPHLDRSVHGLRWPEVASFSLQANIRGITPANRIVFFHGQAKPWMKDTHRTSPWLGTYWSKPR